MTDTETDPADVDISEEAAVAIFVGALGVIVCTWLIFAWRWEALGGVVGSIWWAWHGAKYDEFAIGGNA